MVVYISGPITGTTDYMDRFSDAATMLRRAGFDRIINPAKQLSVLPEETTPHETYMEIALGFLSVANVMVLLDGWQTSKGCQEEVNYAKRRGILILEYHKIKEIKLDG